jgi:mono/diheme cytochrome c family protein
VEEQSGDEEAAETPEPVAAAEDADNTPWLTENPLELSEEALARGQQQFNIYCSVCHGMNGRGNGLVNRRAQKILATTWTPPSNMHDPTLYADVYPDGKLFSTITNGVRKMPGYASQIKAKDRWAIVAYVRALQASQNATLEDVPESQRSKIEKEQAEVQAKLKAAAEAEAAKAAEAAEAE